MKYPAFQDYFDELAAIRTGSEESLPVRLFVAARRGRACGLRAHRVHFDLTEQFSLDEVEAAEREISMIVRKVYRMGNLSDKDYYKKIAFQAVNDFDAAEGAYELPE